MKFLKTISLALFIISLFGLFCRFTQIHQASVSDAVHYDTSASSVEIVNHISGTPELEGNETNSPSTVSPNDPFLSEQWALNRIRAREIWPMTTGHPNIFVAVLDTGIDKKHDDLDDQIVAEVDFTDSTSADDLYGHGTHVAGIIAARSNNGLGITGLAPMSRLMNVKIADDKGKCCISSIADGIIWAVDNGAGVINVSIRLTDAMPRLEEAVDYAWNNGAIVVAAAGNDGSIKPMYPASYKNCIAVTAVREDGSLSPLSNYGNWIDVAAPGFNIYSTIPGNSYDYKTGTSFATAYTSGLAALLFDVVADMNNDGKLNDDVRTAIEAGCQYTGTDGLGRGIIDAAGSIAVIKSNLPQD